MSGLPAGWQTAALFEVCKRIVDGSHNPPKAASDGYPMLSAKNIQQRRVSFDDYRLISGADFSIEHRRTAISPGDVLLTIVGAIGRTAVVDADTPTFTLQRSVAVLRPDNLVPRYLSYALESPLMQKALSENAKGTAQKGVYLKTLSNMVVPLAPLPEQKRIADKLDSVLVRVEACRDRLDRILALLKRFRQSVLAAACSGRLSEDWRQGGSFSPSKSRFENIVTESMTGLVRSTREQSSVASGRKPYLKMNNIGEDWGYDDTELAYVECSSSEQERYCLLPGDWLFNTRNSAELVGKSCVWNGPPVVFNNNLLRVRFKKDVNPWFIEIWFRSPGGRKALAAVKSATTSVAAIYQRSLMAIELDIPCIEEQHEIVRRVETLFGFADRLEARCAAARKQAGQLTPALLAKAFRGELVPQDPADEPAAELLKRLAVSRAEAPKARRGRRTLASST